MSPAAEPEVVGRWETQGLAWFDALDWQKRALKAERRVGQVRCEIEACSVCGATHMRAVLALQVTARLAELERQVGEISSRDKCLLALEQKVERLDSVLRRLEQVQASFLPASRAVNEFSCAQLAAGRGSQIFSRRFAGLCGHGCWCAAAFPSSLTTFNAKILTRSRLQMPSFLG